MGGLREEVVKLLRDLVERYEEFFDSRGCLNSEGRKVLERVARAIVREERWIKEYVRRARRSCSYEDVVRLLEVVERASQGL